MKHISLLTFALLFFIRVTAQIPFSTIDSIAINKINAAMLLHGDMWWDPSTEQSRCAFSWKKNSVLNFTTGIWMSGYDGSSQLHVAAQTYRQNGNDYWPGPLGNTGTLDYATSYRWARFWKINRTDVQLFQSTAVHTTGNTPQSVLTWPGKGNVYAEGAHGLSLSVSNDMAPFVDVNSNGIYEPLSGDYPDVKGDQALWWVFSDNGPAHSETHGTPLGVEVHAMAYAYSRGTPIDYVMYYEYDLVNRSLNNYNNFRFGLFDDLDIGWYIDDFLGFDSSRRLAIGYNGTNNDGADAGYPAGSFGIASPMVGLTMISLPGDVGANYVPMGSFGFINNDASIIGNPTTPAEYDNYLRSKMRDGQHFVRYPGSPCVASGAPIPTNYMYTGDPGDPTSWSECACNNNPGGRRMVLASNDFTLNAGSKQKIVMAFVVTDTGAGGCGGAISFDKIRASSDAAWDGYHHPPAPIPLAQLNVESAKLNAYPNPVSDKLFIDGLSSSLRNESCTVYNTLGQALDLPVSYHDGHLEVDVHSLPPGIYHLLLIGPGSRSLTFVKE